jgi:cysteine synthase A
MVDADSSQVDRRLTGLRSLVGNTPLLALEYTVRGQPRTLYAKAEHMNLTGSVKDRMALHVLARAYERGSLKPGALIAEATSGNTGISFAALGRALGHPVAIFMPDWMSDERKNLLRSYGADIHLVSKAQGGFLGSIRLAEELAARTPGAFLPHQFSNQDNCEAHETTTGPELLAQLQDLGLSPDAFVCGVGTGGTVMGTGRALKRHAPGVKIHPVEPASSPTLSTGHKVGTHRIQGIDDVIAVDDGDAILMAQKLARDTGVAVGISSGANFIAAARVREALGDGAVVTTVFPDSNKKYLSTDLVREEPVKPGYLAPDVELRSFRAIGRVCAACPAPVRWPRGEPPRPAQRA